MRLAALCLFGLLFGNEVTAGEERFDQQDVDAAISRALDYLAEEQQPNGAWLTDAWGESTAITALSVMAYLSAGHVPNEGPYGERIARGVRWIIGQQQPNGLYIQRAQSHGPMYNHGICTLMMAEVIGMMEASDAAEVRRSLEKGVLLILQSQAVNKFDRHQGGWRYQVDSSDSDLSVTGWQVMALRAAKDVGCDVPAESIDAAVEYVKMCAVRTNQGFGYQPGNGATPTLTGVGMTCLEVCGARQTPEALGGARWLRAHPLNEHASYFYYGVYYTGIGMFKMGENFSSDYQRELIQVLLPLQKADGGWTPLHGSERNAGRVYATSLSVLGLAVDYCYLPIYQR